MLILRMTRQVYRNNG